jgi:hypothetical protein
VIIRTEQVQAFSAAVERNFLAELVCEMHDFAPWHAQVLGDRGLWQCAEFALQRAASHGFTNRGPIRLYLQMIFLLGADFDSDPLLPWAAEALSDPIANQSERASNLYTALGAYLKHVAGPDNQFAKDALERAHSELSKGLDSGEESAEQIFKKVRRVYPEKCAYAGDSAVMESIRLGTEMAKRYSAPGAGALFCGLIFAIGHGFETDPHLPWIQKTLNEPEMTGERLVKRLSSRVKTYLDHVKTNVS